jgi:hypothetical protein
MDQSIAALIQLFARLNVEQQDEFISQLNAYIRGGRETKDRIVRESKRFINIDAGPVSGGVCPYCGR